ncbi:phage Gp37/Gp68 family protein [Kaistella sp. PBT33-4]|uniref:DUF5131 family protein n=1 Tax=Kaistella sp. PBT33-4 TaxID=3032000 RepID=UPI0023D7CE11|nr:phage Gp37/Gp68 family protein [Kaistella sp. PBT33-4]MDF0719191.1 phage Gp37/Gp68 family protein [Kaistella sp. PBT33-4]
MSESTIEWTEKTWNPTTGCTVISKECDNCYAKILTDSLQMKGSGKYLQGFDVFAEHPNALKEPFKWKKPTLVFVNSMSDLFHKDMKLEFLQQIFQVMNETPRHTYQVLTKRDAILLELSPELTWTENIWMGVSVGSCVSIRKIDRLRKCGAKNKFLSVEPLIEELPDLNLEGIDWVIVGGENGRGSGIRPIKKDWILKIKKNCEDQNVPFFFKQWGLSRFNPDPSDPTQYKGHPDYAKGGCQINGKMYRENPCVVDPHFGELPFEWD